MLYCSSFGDGRKLISNECDLGILELVYHCWISAAEFKEKVKAGLLLKVKLMKLDL